MENLNLLFYKIYYYEFDSDREVKPTMAEVNEKLFDSSFFPEDFRKLPETLSPKAQRFQLRTTYPGLLVGSGLAHGSGKKDEDVNLGFSLDYTTGQPYIPGSSVKGVLRQAFRMPELIVSLLSEANVEIEPEKVGDLKNEIFEGEDVFFDAVLCAGNNEKKFLGPDTIAPHCGDPTKEPKPILFMKVLPDVRFEFRFRLRDEGTINAAQKTDLFKKLLMIFGVGAKTNVGYGALTDEDVVPEEKQSEGEYAERKGPRTAARQSGFDRRHYSSSSPAAAVIKQCPKCGKSIELRPIGKYFCDDCKKFYSDRQLDEH